MALILNHQTELQFCKKLRDRYKDASGMGACRLIYKTLGYLDAGDITYNKVLNAWNCTRAEWDAKRTAKFQGQADKYAAYTASSAAFAGEVGD